MLNNKQKNNQSHSETTHIESNTLDSHSKSHPVTDEQTQNQFSTPNPIEIATSSSSSTTSLCLSSSNTNSATHSRNSSSGTLHPHIHKIDEDLNLDRLGLDSNVTPHTCISRPHSLHVIAERLTEDDWLDDKCFAQVRRESAKGDMSERSQSVLLECENEDDDEDDEDEDELEEKLNEGSNNSVGSSSSSSKNIMQEKELNEESLRALIDVISDPEKWRSLQQQRRSNSSQNNNAGGSSNSGCRSNDTASGARDYSHSRSKSIGSEHEHIPPTVDMLTDSMGFQDITPPTKANHSIDAKHEKRISLNTVCERLTEEDLDDNKAFLNVPRQKSLAHMEPSVSVVHEEISPDEEDEDSM